MKYFFILLRWGERENRRAAVSFFKCLSFICILTWQLSLRRKTGIELGENTRKLGPRPQNSSRPRFPGGKAGDCKPPAKFTISPPAGIVTEEVFSSVLLCVCLEGSWIAMQWIRKHSECLFAPSYFQGQLEGNRNIIGLATDFLHQKSSFSFGPQLRGLFEYYTEW